MAKKTVFELIADAQEANRAAIASADVASRLLIATLKMLNARHGVSEQDVRGVLQQVESILDAWAKLEPDKAKYAVAALRGFVGKV